MPRRKLTRDDANVQDLSDEDMRPINHKFSDSMSLEVQEEFTTPVALSDELLEEEAKKKLSQETLQRAYRNPALQNDPQVIEVLKASLHDVVGSLDNDKWIYEGGVENDEPTQESSQ